MKWLNRSLLFILMVMMSSLLGAQAPASVFKVHFQRNDQDYEGWTMYVWGNSLNLPRPVTWGDSLPPVSRDAFGVIFEVPLKPSASRLSFILHLGEKKNTPKDVNIVFTTHGYEVWIKDSDQTIYTSNPDAPKPAATPTVPSPQPVTEQAHQTEPSQPTTSPAPPAASPPSAAVPTTSGSVSKPTAPTSAPAPAPAPQAAARTTTSAPTPAAPSIPQRPLSQDLVDSVAQALIREKKMQDDLLALTREAESLKSEVDYYRSLTGGALQSQTILLTLAGAASLLVLGGWTWGFFLLWGRKKLRKQLEAQSQSLVKETETRLLSRSLVDELTHLPNRSGLNQALPLAIGKAKRYKRQLALIFLDLDHFKPINDTLGHEAGDFVLTTIAQRFRECLRESDLIARIGGDEFVILIEDLIDAKFVAAVAQKLLAAAGKGFVIGTQEVHVSASLGIATYPADAADPASLMRCADSAMYAAKEAGRNNYQFFSQELNTHSLQRIALESSIQGALGRKEISLVYLPVVNLANGELRGVEALVRWKHPDMGSVSPLQFLPLAEESGIMVDLGRWILETACRQGRKWLGKPLGVTVNISAKEFFREGFLRELKQILEMTGFPPGGLTLEMREDLLLANPDAAMEAMHQIRDLGVRLSLDDFGTGYSSLSHLKTFPIDVIKIDRSLVSALPQEEDLGLMTSAILAMGQKLGIDVVAEGVSTQEQLDYLLAQGCRSAQGFFFHKPLTAEEVSRLL